MRPRLTVVIPALDAADALPACLGALREAAFACEAVMVDGGSIDGTPSVAEAAGARVVSATKGRGPQLAAGAEAATGDWLLFLHADTVLDTGWSKEVARFMAKENAGRAAYFRFRLDDSAGAARRVERLTAWRCRRFGLPYGDQGLLISRNFYEALGGYRPLPLMEDVDIVRRIGRGRLTALDSVAVTSAARYRRDGYWRRPARNLFCLSLFLLGVPAARVARLYA